MEEQVESGLLGVRYELGEFYKSGTKPAPTKRLTRISKFRAKHLGHTEDGHLKTKCAETWGLLLFLVDVLRRRGGGLEGSAPRFLTAGEALVGLIQTWEDAGPRLTNRQVQTSFDPWATFVAETDELEIGRVPKRHMACHLLLSMRWFGNPSRFANWRDESLNRVLKTSCRNANQSTFEMSVLLRMRHILSQGGVKRRFDAD